MNEFASALVLGIGVPLIIGMVFLPIWALALWIYLKRHEQ